MYVYVGGVNGVGKTSIAQLVAEQLGGEYRHGTKALAQHVGIAEKDFYPAMHAMSQDDLTQFFADHIRSEYGRPSASLVLLDSHYLNLIRGQTFIKTGDWIKLFDRLVLVERDLELVWAETGEVDRRLAHFTEGASGEVMKSELGNYMNATRKHFEDLAQMHGIPAKVLVNQGTLDQAVDELAHWLKQ